MKKLILASALIALGVPAGAQDHVADLDPTALLKMDRANYPETYAAWGTDGVERIEQFRRKAAEAIRREPGCDYVENVDYSSANSIKGQRVAVFAYCQNGSKYTMSEIDLKPRKE